MNKKAQELAKVILPMMAIILSGIALYSFATVEKISDVNDLAIIEILSSLEFNQDYLESLSLLLFNETLTNCPSCSNSKLKSDFKESATWRAQRFASPELGDYFSKIHNGEFNITSSDEIVSLKIQNITINSQKNHNSIERTFSICIESSKKGEFLKDCD